MRLLFLILICPSLLWANSWKNQIALHQEMEKFTYNFFHGKKNPSQNYPLMKVKSSPLFITIEREGRTLLCLGDIRAHQSNLMEELTALLIKSQQYPHLGQGIATAEKKAWTIWIRFPGKPQRIRSMEEFNLRHEGLLLKSGPQASIGLPGEARTKQFLLKLLKRKAQLSQGDRFALYKIPTQGFSFKAF